LAVVDGGSTGVEAFVAEGTMLRFRRENATGHPPRNPARVIILPFVFVGDDDVGLQLLLLLLLLLFILLPSLFCGTTREGGRRL